jgi:exonuclease SbcC
MKITQFSFKNICSYGNKLQTFKFSEDPQLILVQGKNGSGKSSISDALTVALYGKSSIRKTKEIPNRINKNAYTHIEFIAANGDKIEIERGLEPNFSKLLINNSEHNLPDKRRVDEFIEEELTKIPFNVFSNTISLSVNDFKSFVKLSPHDKRQIIDKIFGLDIVNDMSKVVKEEVKDLRTSIHSIDSTLVNNNSILQNSISQLDNLKLDLNSAKAVRISELTAEITKLSNQKEEKRLVYTSLNSQVGIIEKSITVARDLKASTQYTITEIQKKLDDATLRQTAAQAKLTAAKTDADKKLLTTAVASWTSATRAYASKIRNIDLTIKKLEAAKLVATNKPAELAANITNARDSAKLICTKGF